MMLVVMLLMPLFMTCVFFKMKVETSKVMQTMTMSRLHLIVWFFIWSCCVCMEFKETRRDQWIICGSWVCFCCNISKKLVNEVLPDEDWKDEINVWNFFKKILKEDCWRLIFFLFYYYFLLIFSGIIRMLLVFK